MLPVHMEGGCQELESNKISHECNFTQEHARSRGRSDRVLHQDADRTADWPHLACAGWQVQMFALRDSARHVLMVVVSGRERSVGISL